MDSIYYKNSVPLAELPQIYSQYQISVDITHSPFINGCTSKVLDCFASGGYMFSDKKSDLYASVGGEIADYFMYSNSNDLLNKIETVKSNDKLRENIIKEMQDKIRNSLTLEAVIEKSVQSIIGLS